MFKNITTLALIFSIFFQSLPMARAELSTPQKSDTIVTQKEILRTKKVKNVLGETEKQKVFEKHQNAKVWKDFVRKIVRVTKSADEKQKLSKIDEKRDEKDLIGKLNSAMKKSLAIKNANIFGPVDKNVEPNFLFAPSGFTTNDPLSSRQWGLQKIMPNGLPTISTGAKTIDTGFDTGHEDLRGNLWRRDICVSHTGAILPGGCKNGGFDFVDGDNDPLATDFSHGTSVAGAVGAATQNNLGIASAGDKNVEIMALRACCSVDGFFEVQKIIDAIYFAVENNAKVINMSFGGPTASTALQEAINFAENRGVLVVAAAGNMGESLDLNPIYPASYKNANIINVAASG